MNPQEQFKKYQPEHAGTLRVESQRSWFLTSLIYAQAAVVDRGATADEINGMNRFAEMLVQLAADTPEIVKLPVKKLAVLDGPTAPGADLQEQPKDKK